MSTATKLPSNSNVLQTWILPFIKSLPPPEKSSAAAAAAAAAASPIISIPKPSRGKVSKMLKLSKIYLPPQEHFRIKIFKRRSSPQRGARGPANESSEKVKKVAMEEEDGHNPNDDTEPVPATARNDFLENVIRSEYNKREDGEDENFQDYTSGIKESIVDSCVDATSPQTSHCYANPRHCDIIAAATPDDSSNFTIVNPLPNCSGNNNDDQSLTPMQQPPAPPAVDFHELCKNMKKLNLQIDKLLKKPDNARFSEAAAIELESELLTFQDSIPQPVYKIPKDSKRKTNIKRLLKRNRKVFSIVRAWFFPQRRNEKTETKLQ